MAGIDNLNAYYDPALKRARLAGLASHDAFQFEPLNIADRAACAAFFRRVRPAYVLHFAAQAGVRYSLENPAEYVDSNLVGFANILEGCRAASSRHLIFASSSSVYGGNTELPFAVDQNVDHPLSLYAATKKSNELMAHTYSHLFGLPTSGLRLFTVYGPWGSPDMAVFKFTNAIWNGQPIQVFNHGDMSRDLTYIDDVVEAVVRLIPKPPLPDPDRSQSALRPATSFAPYRVLNVGNHDPVQLMELIRLIETALGRKAILDFQPMHPSDVKATFADVSDLEALVDFAPQTPLASGVERFVSWYRDIYLPMLASKA